MINIQQIDNGNVNGTTQVSGEISAIQRKQEDFSTSHQFLSLLKLPPCWIPQFTEHALRMGPLFTSVKQRRPRMSRFKQLNALSNRSYGMTPDEA